MKSMAVYILFRSSIIQNRDRIIGVITIVIPDNNFCCDACCLECGAKMIFYKIGLLCSRHNHAWIVTTMLWFILRGNSINSNSLCFHGLYILYKILSIHSIILWL